MTNRPAGRGTLRRPVRGARRGGRSAAPASPPRESAAARARRARAIAARLAQRYPRAEIPLHHRTRLELLVATILSAQSTDAMVNRVTPALFERYRTAADYAGARTSELEAMIHSTGFFHAKARAIQAMARALLERHDGEVPQTMDELVALPGVGRKTANVVLGASGIPGVVVDTHVLRLTRRLALTVNHDPVKIEQDIGTLLPPAEWSDFSLRLIYFGREVCTAIRPRCPECPLRDLCPSARYLGSPPWIVKRPKPATTKDGTRTVGAAGRRRTTAAGRRGHSSRGRRAAAAPAPKTARRTTG
ncbi:MAG TPA: endonuclease III [bacterium]|nr:endonuclease III [bacterium]